MPVHPTALVSQAARLAPDVDVGPFTVIDGPAELASGVRIAGHAWLHGRLAVGPRTSIGWGAIVGGDPQDLAFDPATDSAVTLGPDNSIRDYVTIHRSTQPGGATRIGARNLLMTGAHVAHDCIIGDDCALANNVLLGGHVHVGNRAFLGGGAGFHQFVHVGPLAIVQGNAAISQDVPPFSLAYGRNTLAGLNTVGLRRAGLNPNARAEIKRLFQLLFGSGLPLTAALARARQTAWSDTAQLLLDAAANPSRKGIMTRG